MRPKFSGLAGILAQAPAVSAAFGKWPGFILMMTAILGFFALSVFTILVASNEVKYLVLLNRLEAGELQYHGLSTLPEREHFE